jgi:hypothetical protein
MTFDIRSAKKQQDRPGEGTPIPTMHKTTAPKGPGTLSRDMQDEPVQGPVETESRTDTSTGISDPVEDVETFKTDLYKEGYKDEDFFRVLDTLLTEDNYYFEFDILGKKKVVLGIRPDWVQMAVIEKVEAAAPKTVARFTEIINRYNLAGSLVQYGDTAFTLEDEAGLTKALDFIADLPFIIINVLIRRLIEFDHLVSVATSAWALENFIEPQSEK